MIYRSLFIVYKCYRQDSLGEGWVVAQLLKLTGRYMIDQYLTVLEGINCLHLTPICSNKIFECKYKVLGSLICSNIQTNKCAILSIVTSNN